ncbi:glycosyltransferase family 1 protein [Aquabacter sp. CN5-332]|uniref:glycosyltransferase family 4 protein n=1 Tax=Aquabacter sp. CN5-332 TaxID=3156608 RepID=UPI0032B38241
MIKATEDWSDDNFSPNHDDLRNGFDIHRREYIVDFSLSLINKTGAYYVTRDIVRHFPELFVAQRYWRLRLRSEPQGVTRRLLGTAMLLELAFPLLSRMLHRRGNAISTERTLFLDPLYVLFSGVAPGDIVLCHDVGPLTLPDAFDGNTAERYREAYRLISAARPGMVFVSEASRLEFVSLFGDDFRFLEVIPLYTRTDSERGEDVEPRDMKAPFLLTVGALEVRKNHQRSIEAFQRSGLRERGFEYVLCGPRGNDAAAVERLVDETPGVRWLGYLRDAELRWLYRHAKGFVLPSLLEGFGLPALEAAKNGLVPLISSQGALLEAANAGAILVDPRSVDDIAAGMRQLVDMTAAERTRRIAQLQEHARSMSLERYIARWGGLLASDMKASAKPAAARV